MTVNTLGILFHRPTPSFSARVRTWVMRHRMRRDLSRLDDRLLKDVGLSRIDVEHEASKPFWRS